MNPYKIEVLIAQHIGSRSQQADRAALFSGARAPGYALAVLADGGAGGAGAPEQVLHTAKHLFDAFKPGDRPSLERLEQLLRDIVHESHMMIKMNGVASGAEAHCTFVGLILTPHGQAVWAHVGDSRLYGFADADCQLRTSDAGYIEHLVGEDQLPPEAARKYRRSRMLHNVLGNSRKEPFVTLGGHEGLVGGDSFLLCSDGLWHFFTDAELGAALSKNTPREAAEKLIDKASQRAAGKGDNCSMAIVKLVRPPKEAPAKFSAQKLKRAV